VSLLYPQFETNFNIQVDDKKLFMILGVNLASLLAYCTDAAPNKEVPKKVPGRGEDMKFIGSSTFKGGGDDDDGDYDSEYSGGSGSDEE
jgi:hypothetical protein